MADNTTLNSGAGGDTIAADDIGGVKFQRIKLVLGTDGINDGDVAASNPIPVTGTLSAISGTVTIVGSVSTTVATGTTQVFGTVQVVNTVPIVGGTVLVTNTVPIIGGTVLVTNTVPVTVLGGTLAALTGTVTVVGSVHGTVSIGGGTLAAITGTVPVVASPSDAQTQWGAGSVNIIQVGLVTPAGTVAAGAGLPVSGTLSAIIGTVTVVGSVTTTTTPGTTQVFGTVQVVNTVPIIGSITAGTLSVLVRDGTLAALIGTVTVVGSVHGTVFIGSTVPIVGGTVLVTNTVPITGSVTLLGTLPDSSRNKSLLIVAG